MNKVVIDIQSELDKLYIIFSRKIPNFTLNISPNTIKLHMKPYIEWRHEFLQKTTIYNNYITNVKKYDELIYTLLYVEYCSVSFNIVPSDNYNFFNELIKMYPNSIFYKVNNLNYTYYPITNLLSNYCYNKNISGYSVIYTNVLVPIANDFNVKLFIELYYSITNNTLIKERFIDLLHMMTKNNFAELNNHPLDKLIIEACKVPRIERDIFIYIKKEIERNHSNTPYTSYMIDSAKILYKAFICIESHLTRFIYKKKQHDIYYGYYLLHLYLYKGCEASFITHLSKLKKYIRKKNIQIFNYSQYWEWLFEIITRFQIKYPKEFKKTSEETVRIYELYCMLQDTCREKYAIFSYYDSKLAWLICYPDNLRLVENLYNDLNRNTELYNYQKIYHDIARYGTYKLVLSSWYYVSSELRYFKDISYSYYAHVDTFNNDNAFTLSIMNKDKRVFKFICDHFEEKEIDTNLISKAIHNLLTFYSSCNKWKKDILLKECKYRLNLLLENFYFKNIWMAFLMGYYYYSIEYRADENIFTYLFKWILKKCILIETNQVVARKHINTNEFDNYFWICVISSKIHNNQKCRDVMIEYRDIICSKELKKTELFDYNDVIAYLFIDAVYYFSKNKETSVPKSLEDKMFDMFQRFSDNINSIFIILLKLSVIRENKKRSIKKCKTNRFKTVVSYLLDYFKRYNFNKKSQLFYIIRNQGFLENDEILDWCIRNGLEYYDKPYWILLKDFYKKNKNYYETSHYKWNRVGEIMKKGIFRLRMRKNNLSKQLLHIELINNYTIKNIINNVHEEEKYSKLKLNPLNHPIHISKKDTCELLKDSTWISPKINGVRKLLYVNDLEKMHPKLLYQSREILQKYYFVAEKLVFQERTIYFIYEIWNKNKNRELNEFEVCKVYKLIQKQSNLFTKERLEFLLSNKDEIDDHSHEINSSRDKLDNKDIWLFKPFYYALPNIDGLLRWKYIYDKYSFIPNDGLIIKTRKNAKYKLKPIEHMTIDLKVKRGKGIDAEKNEYPISLENTNKNMKKMNLDILENEIVQCIFERDEKVWKIKKIRNDKKCPNSREIIKIIEDIYKEPFWIDDLLLTIKHSHKYI